MPTQTAPSKAAQTQKPAILCLPTAANNPYQTLMYCEAAKAAQFDFAGPGGLSQLAEHKHAVLHIHWDDRMFGRSTDPEENARTLNAAIEALRAFKARGGRLVWTIHNRLPHKVIDLEAFEQGRAALSDLADAIHVHAAHASDFMRETFNTDPGKLTVIPHPSYLGAYEPKTKTLTRTLSGGSTRQFLFFGMFRGDKGVHEIRDVAGKLAKRGYDFHLRMYGKAFASQARLTRLLDANPQIDLRTDRIPDEEIPGIFGSSHVFLAPYRSLFTSGSVMLALTFGLPIIGPNIRELRETTPEQCHDLLYDPDAPRGLIKSMILATQMPRNELRSYRRACFDFAQKRAPQIIGGQMAQLLGVAPKAARSDRLKKGAL